MSSPYSNDKMVWWYAREGGFPNAPKQVELILSDLCNQNCSFCAYRKDGYTSNELFVGDSKRSKYGKDNPVRWIETERAHSLLTEIHDAGVLGLQFTGGGEPTVHPHHEDLFEHALSLGMKCALVSNGVKWSERLMRDILPRFSWVRISLDAGDPVTYSAVRQTPIDHWDKVLAHMERLATEIRLAESDCVFGIGWVVTPKNYKGIIDGIRVCAESGAKYVRLSAEFNPLGTKIYTEPVDIWDEIKASIAEARKRYERQDFAIFDLFRDRMQDLADGPPDYKVCGHQYYTHYIGGDLRAYRCCVLAYNTRGLIAGGDLSKRSFGDFWNSPERKADMAGFDARACKFCQFNDKNRRVAALLDDNPTHKEFP